MKKIFIFLTGMVLLAACSQDFIDLNPPSSLNSLGFYKTQADLNQAVLSAYGNLRSVYNGNFVRLGEIRSDNTTFSWLAGNPANEKGIDGGFKSIKSWLQAASNTIPVKNMNIFFIYI